MSGHAKLSPSSAARWLRCLGSVLGPQSDESSEFADEGTAAHEAASLILQGKVVPPWINVLNADGTVRRSFEYTTEMESFVYVYVNSVRDRLHDGAQLMVEQRVDTGIRDDEGNPVDGTGDAIILDPEFGLIDVHDLKYGKGHKVWGLRRVSDIPDGYPVGPVLLLEGERYEMNPQLAIYGLGALNQFGLLGSFKGVRVTIHQPRLDHMSEATIGVEDLLAWGEGVKQFILAWDTSLRPGDEQCQWCPRKATCTALQARVTDAVMNDFANVADLTEFGIAKAYEQVELVKQWLAAIEAAARSLADKGQLPGWEWDEGRAGNRKWKDEKAVITIFKDSYRWKDDEMYNKKLISPTDAEKKIAKTNPTRWERLQEHIERGPPSKTLVRAGTAKRPIAVSNVADDFKAVEFGDLLGKAS
jgi:hypothetical protein